MADTPRFPVRDQKANQVMIMLTAFSTDGEFHVDDETQNLLRITLFDGCLLLTVKGGETVLLKDLYPDHKRKE